jgi:hypothetical protein
MTPHVEQSLTAKDPVLGSIIEVPNGLMKLSCQLKKQQQKVVGEHVEELSPK